MLDFERYYHVYNHANGDDNLFRESKNYDFFLEKCQFHILPIADTLAWCLMPNHFHLLIKIKSEEEIELSFPKFKTLEKIERRKFLSKQFSNFFSSYSQAFNKVYRRRGSLFLKNFKRKEIGSDNYLKNIILYIHLNPIKHGFTRTFQDWRYTSFFEFPNLNPDLVELIFGDENNYLLVHQEKISDFTEYDNFENELTWTAVIKRTLYFGNHAYLKTKNKQLVITLKETAEAQQIPIENIGCERQKLVKN